MSLRHLTCLGTGFVLAIALVLTAGPVVLAKEGIKARLTAPLNMDASPGEKITVAWTLGMSDEQGNQRPFNAMGVFVRLMSVRGGTPTMGFATAAAHTDGRYTAQVAVPQGGIGGVQIGVRGSSDIIFPLENDPFLVRATAAASTRKETTSISFTTIVVAIVPIFAALVLSGILGAAQIRRQM
jgi:hypothetical protein